MSRDRAFTFALLKKLAVPVGMLALIGAAATSSVGCSSTPTPGQTTGTGGAVGGGGAGGESTSTGGCATAEQCPGTDTDCQKRSCVMGVCGVENAPAGVATSAQTAGDCQASVCDGMGATTTQSDDADVLDDQNDCTDDVCAAGAPENKPRSSGSACASNGGKVCDGASKCVECVVASGCDDGVCSQNSCVPGSCLDTVKNNAETDVDCGGKDCNPCAGGKACAAGSDCIDTICAGGICAKATCSDAAKNGGETDVDCGGALCKGCGPDLGCKVDADCAGGSCSGTTCLPTCSDAVKNANETDVDCGGPTCGACLDAKTCAVAADCKSKVCTGGACQAPSCTDGVKNGTESDLDCGGACGPCSPSQACTVPADCATKVCTGNVCQGAICNDGAKNGSETDVDCGGLCATKCAAGKSCGVGSDCASLLCAGGVCKASICGDGVINGAELCDDGNPVSGDGCSSACAVEAGFSCAGAAPSLCMPICGDGIKAGVEQCDDGNPTTGDGCSSACAVEIGFDCSGSPSVCLTTCGDGFKAVTEACDDGNGIPGDGCAPTCGVEPGFTCTGTSPSVCKATCGDGIKAGAEQCDDGNVLAGDGCSATCAVQSGFTCTGAMPSVCTTACGDGVKAGAEACDDNNKAGGDCCSPTCQIEAGCEVEVNDASATANGFATTSVGGKINGFIRPVGDKDYYAFVVPANGVGKITATTIDSFLGVACTSNTLDTYLTLYSASATSIATNEDINSSTNYCSSLTASNLAAGTYYVEVKASSLASITTFAYTLQASISVCGNGVIEAPEVCDGGPTCAADCTLLPVCGDGVINGNDVCDDGNTLGGDGCSATCLFESGTNEVEKNNTQAQADANPVMTGDGQLVGSLGSGDKDIFKVTLAASSVVRFETFEGVTLDCPTIDLTMKLFDSTFTQQKIDVQGTANASGINNCAALVLALPAGSYYVQIEKTTAGTVPRYAFQTKFSTSVGSEIEPNNTSATATALAGTEVNVAGAHVTSDLDWYAITLASSGLSVRAETIEETVDTLVSTKNCENLNTDTTLTLYNAAATSLVSDTDDGRGFCSAIDGTGATPRDAAAHNLAAGTYYLQVSGGGTYNYRLAVTLR